MKSVWVCVLAGVSWGAAVGCSSTDEDASELVSSDEVRNFLAEKARIICESSAACCTQAQRPHDVQACTESLTVIPLGPLGYDPGAAADCLSGLSVSHGTCPPGPEPEACERAVRGTAKLGEACSYDFDCELIAGESVRCSFETHTCQKRVPVTAGSACDYEANAEWSNCAVVVDADHHCDYDTDTCQPNTPIGSPCTIEAECGIEGHCTGGECAARVAIGGDCSALQCVHEAYCNESGVCVADKGIGEACSSNPECPGDVCSSETGVCSSVQGAACIQ